jgi:predicted amidophosphoribosyltransferase
VISDFYALPQFGKTRLGNLVHVCKTAPLPKYLTLLCTLIEQDLTNLIEELNIDTLCWVPHSLKRAIPFLPAIQKKLKLRKPHIKVRKIFSGAVPVPQKSLSRLEDRIENARSTLYVDEFAGSPQRILIIDDAVGSGATINELSKILRRNFKPKEIHAYAIVGSYKGFDVISQV